MADQIFDVIVIGGGPGGYVAAIRAAQLGLATRWSNATNSAACASTGAAFRRKRCCTRLTCCATSKAPRRWASTRDRCRVDLQRVVARSRTVAQQLNRGVTGLLKKNKVTVIKGSARLTGPGHVVVDGKQPATLAADAHRDRHRRASEGAARHRSGRQTRLDIARSDGAGRAAEAPARHRRRRDRRGVREPLPDARQAK